VGEVCCPEDFDISSCNFTVIITGNHIGFKALVVSIQTVQQVAVSLSPVFFPFNSFLKSSFHRLFFLDAVGWFRAGAWMFVTGSLLFVTGATATGGPERTNRIGEPEE